MNKTNENKASVVSQINRGKKLKWSIEFDEKLSMLLDLEGIEDPSHQMMVCEAFCRIGLAKHRLFGEDTDKCEVQEHCYTSTKAMRELAEKCHL
jgi:hypothetical protein